MALLFIPFLSRAQSITERIHTIDSVSVMALRPLRDAAVIRTVIDSVAVQETLNASFSELLSRHSPVYVKTYGMGSNATVSFRGTGASHTKVEWNGITINNPMLGQVDFSQIPVWFADNVELSHGAASLQRGSGALGGTVSVSSTPVWNVPFSGSVLAGAGSYGLRQGFVSAAGSAGSFSYKVRFMHEQAENDFSYTNVSLMGDPEMKQENADYRKEAVTGDIYWRPSGRDLIAVSVWCHDSRRNLPLPMVYVRQEGGEKQNDADMRTSLRWSHYGRKWRGSLVSGFQYLSLEYSQKVNGGSVVNYDTYSRAVSLLNRYTLDYDFSERSSLSVSVNADHNYARVENRKPDIPVVTKADRLEIGASATYHHRLSDMVSAYALVRGEVADGDLLTPMPSVGIEVRPLRKSADELRIALSATRNHHLPTLNDLYWQPGGNPDLKPERGYSTDLSAEYEMRRGAFSTRMVVSGYASLINDWISWTPVGGSWWRAENHRKIFSRGVESFASVRYRVGRSSVALSVNYGYTKSTNEKTYTEHDESKGKQLVYVPLHKGSVMLDASCRGWYVWWVWSAVSERHLTSSNERIGDNLPSYDLHDITAGKGLTVWRIGIDMQLKVNNAFSRVYRALPQRPMPLRNYAFLLRITF